MDIRIERTDESGYCEWEAVLNLVQGAFAYMDDRVDPPSSCHSMTAFKFEEKAKRTICCLAKDDNNNLVGCLFLKPESNCVYMSSFAVNPALHGNGIGKKLLTYAELIAKSLDLAAIRLEVRIELIELHQMYEKWGFIKTAERAHEGYTRPTYYEMMKRLS